MFCVAFSSMNHIDKEAFFLIVASEEMYFSSHLLILLHLYNYLFHSCLLWAFTQVTDSITQHTQFININMRETSRNKFVLLLYLLTIS
jgi:hypothetical protein